MKKKYLQKLLIIAVPIMLSNVISQIQMIIDRIFLGQMNTLYMSALGNVTYCCHQYLRNFLFPLFVWGVVAATHALAEMPSFLIGPSTNKGVWGQYK